MVIDPRRCGIPCGVLLALAATIAVVADSGECPCDDGASLGRWCDTHRLARIGGIEIRSEILFEALDAHGHDVDLESFDCPGCRAAIEQEGFCEDHRVGFVARQAYFSRLTHGLAAGIPRDPSSRDCPTCRKNEASHGWCDACSRGLVGPTQIDDRQEFEAVARSIRLVELANRVALRCEHCAVAVVTDTTCPVCRIRYRDGAPIQD